MGYVVRDAGYALGVHHKLGGALALPGSRHTSST